MKIQSFSTHLSLRNLHILAGLCLVCAAITENPLAFAPGVIFLAALGFQPWVLLQKQAFLDFLKVQKVPLIFLVAVAGLALLSVLWSARPDLSLERAKKVGVLLFFGAGLYYTTLRCLQGNTSSQEKGIFKIFAIAALLTITILMALSALKFPLLLDFYNLMPSMLNKPFLVICLCMIPIAGFLFLNKDYLLLTITGALLALCFYFTASQASYLIPLTALLALGAHFIFKRATSIIFAVLWALTFAFLPFLIIFIEDILLQFISTHPEWNRHASPFARIEIWVGTARLIMDAPFLGYGIGSFRDMPLPLDRVYIPNSTMLHPHNLILQIWFELGVLGLVLALGIIAYFFKKIHALPDALRALSLMLINAYLMQMQVSYGIWQSWSIGFIFILLLYTLLSFHLIKTRALSKNV